MKQRKRWMAVLTVWTIALLFAAGFTSQASVSSSKMIQEKNSKYTTGAGAIAAAISLLADSAAIPLEELDEILLAGAFGNYIRPYMFMPVFAVLLSIAAIPLIYRRFKNHQV